MRTTLKKYAELKRGYTELHDIKHDPDGLVKMLERVRAEDGAIDLRTALILAMRRHGSSDRVMACLAETIREADHWRERLLATVALAEIGTPRARVPLVLALSDDDRRVRGKAELGIRLLDNGEARRNRASRGSRTARKHESRLRTARTSKAGSRTAGTSKIDACS